MNKSGKLYILSAVLLAIGLVGAFQADTVLRYINIDKEILNTLSWALILVGAIEIAILTMKKNDKADKPNH